MKFAANTHQHAVTIATATHTLRFADFKAMRVLSVQFQSKFSFTSHNKISMPLSSEAQVTDRHLCVDVEFLREIEGRRGLSLCGNTEKSDHSG